MFKTVMKRGLILGLIFVAIALVGGIAFFDLPIIIIIGLLVLILAGVMVLIHNQKGE